jgi:hypothetical protein
MKKLRKLEWVERKYMTFIYQGNRKQDDEAKVIKVNRMKLQKPVPSSL